MIDFELERASVKFKAVSPLYLIIEAKLDRSKSCNHDVEAMSVHNIHLPSSSTPGQVSGK